MCKQGKHQYCHCPVSPLYYERRTIQNCTLEMSTTLRYFKKIHRSHLKICIKRIASSLWLSRLKQSWVELRWNSWAFYSKIWGTQGENQGWMDCPQALVLPYGSSPGLERDLQRDFMRTPSSGHGVWNRGFAVNSASYVLFFFVIFPLSHLFTFCLVRAWLNRPRLHLLQHCCEPVTNETAKSNALNSPVLLKVCQILQRLIRVCAALEFLQLLLWIFKGV